MQICIQEYVGHQKDKNSGHGYIYYARLLYEGEGDTSVGQKWKKWELIYLMGGCLYHKHK